jgi:prepilin-type N-terminal cleavage/methylation domain-containing protein
MTIPSVLRLTATPQRAAGQRAYTIIELLAVVALIGLTASVLIPSAIPGESKKLDIVAMEVANAMRFARSEAMRTGNTLGFQQQSTINRMRIFNIDIGSVPATFEYNVYHPVDKDLYTRWFGEQPFAFNGEMQNLSTYQGTCNLKSKIYFDADGTPWCTDPVTVLLERFDVDLKLGTSSRIVTLHGITGRVTIQ